MRRARKRMRTRKYPVLAMEGGEQTDSDQQKEVSENALERKIVPPNLKRDVARRSASADDDDMEDSSCSSEDSFDELAKTLGVHKLDTGFFKKFAQRA